MTDLGIADDIAFIRRTVEQGRLYARGRSADMLVWGLFVAAAELITYARVRHWMGISPGWVWLVAIALPWAYSLRRVGARLLGREVAARNPMATAMSMLWLGCGLSLMTLAFAANSSRVGGYHWFDVAVAAILAIGFFASSSLCNLGWMRVVAFGWWLGAFALCVLPDNPNLLLVDAFLMLVLLAGPGLMLLLGRRS